MSVKAPAGVVCRKCGSHDVLCIQHPTAHYGKQWFVWECQHCGHRGGAHRHQRP